MELTLQNVSLELGGKPVLDDVSFTVGSGQFVSVLGESGAGKSTTLKVIAGLLLQDRGKILFDGECIDELPTCKRQTAIVFQDIRLFPNMNAVDNVAFPLRMRGMRKAERRARAEELLEAVHLAGFGARQSHELSGGQQQRVALARALAAQPRALLLDEPFSGLDEALRGDMRALVAELHEKFAITSLMVTHDPDEALVMSDSIVYLSEGKVVQAGPPDQLLLHPADAAVAACFDAPSSIEGEVRDGLFRRGKLAVPADGAASGPAVLVRAPGRSPFIHSFS